MRSIILIVHNIRSIHNVGSIFRTCEGFGVDKIIFSGYTPYPEQPNDTRLPHIYRKLNSSIAKTALGAEKIVPNNYEENVEATLLRLKTEGYVIIALEQHTTSINISSYQPPQKIVLLIGEEVHGITPNLLALCDTTIEIPMYGKKESFNVSVATGIALYHLRVTK